MPHRWNRCFEELNKMNYSRTPKVIMLTAFGHKISPERQWNSVRLIIFLKPFNLEILAERIPSTGQKKCSTPKTAPPVHVKTLHAKK